MRAASDGGGEFHAASRPGFAPKWAVQCEIDEQDRLRRLYTVLASRKLVRVR